jgi:hypothetical protein
MTMAQLTVVGAGLSFVFIFLSGLWLSRHEKPFNSLVLNIHKLIALAVGIFVVVTAYRTNQVATPGTTGLTATGVTGLLFLGTGITGGLLSIDKPMPDAIQWAHRITPYVTVLSTAVTLFLVLGST